MVARGTVGEVEGQRRQHHRPGGRIQHGAQRVAHHRRLLVDLLQHVVAEIALADQRPGLGDRLDRPFDRLVLGVVDLDAAAGDHRPVALVEIADPVGPGPDRQGVGADIHLAVAEADGQRRAAAGDHQQILLAIEQEGQREGALQPLQRRGAGLARRQLLVEIVADQMSDDLGIGLGGEDMAEALELAPQLAEVLDDAVVHDRDPVGRMRMGVGLARPAMRRPAGVADADGAVDRVLAQAPLQIGQLALGPAALDPAADQGGDAGRIIAAILQALQRLDQAGRDRPGPDDADDAAHHLFSWSRLDFAAFSAFLFSR